MDDGYEGLTSDERVERPKSRLTETRPINYKSDELTRRDKTIIEGKISIIDEKLIRLDDQFQQLVDKIGFALGSAYPNAEKGETEDTPDQSGLAHELDRIARKIAGLTTAMVSVIDRVEL